MKKYMPLEGLRWSRDSGSALCDTSQNSRSRTGWGVGRLLSPRQHETFPHENGRVVKATATYVYMEIVEEGENENCQLGKVRY